MLFPALASLPPPFSRVYPDASHSFSLHADKFFYEYLQRVKDENESEFPEIEYIMDRHSVLSGELAGLQEKQLKLTAESEQLRNVFQQYTKDQMNMNLGLGNDIARTLH